MKNTNDYFYLDELTTSDKLYVLRSTLDELEYEYIKNGICTHLANSIEEIRTLLSRDDIYFNLDKIIPEFNIENATKLSVKYKFETPELHHGFWWADREDTKPRIAFIKALILELELKKSFCKRFLRFFNITSVKL